jgi:ABC-type branched-subunit amino acid transport system ATPase component/ABC-type branched-subunit amino acid transport system permease subunit
MALAVSGPLVDRLRTALTRAAAVIGAGAGLVLAVEIVFGRDSTTHILGVPVPNGVTTGVLLNGAILGMLYALLAFGLILVYRATRIINFAHAGLGLVPAVTALLLVTNHGWPYPAALVVMIAGSAFVGALIEFVMRKFDDAPRLVMTVFTIGLAQVFVYLELQLPQWIGGSTVLPFNFPTPYSGYSFEIGGIIFNGDYLAIVVATAFVCASLAAFFKFTRAGIAIRASAENRDRAATLGVPVRRLSTLVWVLAGVCSGIAVFLQAPVTSLPAGGTVSPLVLLYGLAAAVVARMESLPIALGAGIGVGVIQQAAFAGSSRPDDAAALMLPVVLGALLLQRRRVGRAFETGLSSFRSLQELRPVPLELRGLPEIRYARIALLAVVSGIALAGPYLVGTARTGFCTQAIIAGIIAVSLVVLSGWAGQISLGQFALAGVGAAVAGGLATRHDTDFFVTLVVATLVGAVVALLIGLPALRLPGLFLAVVTLAFAAAVQYAGLSRARFGWLLPPNGAYITKPLLYGRFDLQRSTTGFYYLCLAALALACASAWSLRHSRSGRLFIGMRDNQRAAQAFGVNATSTRLAAFAISGAMAALAGALSAYQSQVDQGSFTMDASLTAFLFAVVGGLTSIPGAVLATVGYTALGYFAGSGLAVLGSGVGAASILLTFPGGLAQASQHLRDRLLRLIARRRGIRVPSLLADSRLLDDETPASTEKQDAHAAVEQRSDVLLDCRDVNVAYDGVQVLFGVDLEVSRGEIVALLGTNGAGKSTLLKAITGLIGPSGGTISFGGDDVTGADARSLARRGIALMPGGRGVFPTLTVDEHFTVARWLVSDPAEARASTEDAFARFPVLRERRRQLAGNLSGGEQQMLALSMALIAKPVLLLIDELALGLAPTIVERLLDAVRQINAQGTTVVIVEQSVNLALTVADRAYFLEKGEVRFSGATRELLDRADIMRSMFIAGAAQPRGRRRKTPRASGKGWEAPILEAERVSVSFGGIVALDSVDLMVGKGEIVGVFGPNGAGKTTLFDVVSGFVAPTSGRVRLDGADVTSIGPDGRARLGLGRSFQDARIFASLTVAENLAYSLERHLPIRDHAAAALGLPAIRDQEDDVAWSVSDLVALLGLGDYRDKFVSELSTGSRRVVDLAMALAHDPRVLILDEPSSGLAQRETEALTPLLQRIREETGCAMLVIEHDVPMLSSLCDRLVAMDLGRVIAAGPARQVLDDPAVVEAYLGCDPATIARSGSAVPV